jgi:hypothetical protein
LYFGGPAHLKLNGKSKAAQKESKSEIEREREGERERERERESERDIFLVFPYTLMHGFLAFQPSEKT